jgi:hypothetical protein
MAPNEQNDQVTVPLKLDDRSCNYLADIAKWSKFLAVAGLIVCSVLVLIGVFAGTLISKAVGLNSEGGGTRIVFSIIYIALIVVYFMPCYYLYRFSGYLQAALKAGDPMKLQKAFKNLKSCFKFMGILTILLLSIYALAILVAGIAASFAK